MKILNFGSINKDLVYLVDDFVKPGQTISSNNHEIFLGGKGLNQSVAIARAGSKIHHAGAINKDDDYIIKTLKKWGVETSNINYVNKSTGHAIIQVDKRGENSIIIFGGANQCIDNNHIEETLSSFSSGDYILLQNEINNIDEIIKRAYNKGIKIIFNPAPYSKNVQNYCLEKIDTLIYNETEGESLSGKKDKFDIVGELSSRYPKTKQLITLGKNGSLYFFENKTIEVRAKKINTVDTTAAGDTYIGYYISCISKEKSVKESMQIASRAAAISTTKLGGASSIPTLN